MTGTISDRSLRISSRQSNELERNLIMATELHTLFNGKRSVAYVGDLTLVFSYSTLVGFAVPGIGRVRSANVWGPTTGKHLNAWSALHENVPRGTFIAAAEVLDSYVAGRMTRRGLLTRLSTILQIPNPQRGRKP